MMMMMMVVVCSESKSGFYGSSLESIYERHDCDAGKCPTVSRFSTIY